LSFKHVMARGSLPPGFPMTKVEGNSYWDGGLFENTPLSPAQVAPHGTVDEG
jgi:NTE family protein